jgi:hypothetical protein
VEEQEQVEETTRERGGRVVAGLRFSRPRARTCRCRGS